MRRISVPRWMVDRRAALEITQVAHGQRGIVGRGDQVVVEQSALENGAAIAPGGAHSLGPWDDRRFGNSAMSVVVRAALLAVVALLLGPLLTVPIQAQLDPGDFEIRQNGATVGEIFVPVRRPGTATYVEHWVLSPRYIYPGPHNTTATQIRLSHKSYVSEADFFARVPFSPGYRYVRIDVTESDSLPGR